MSQRLPTKLNLTVPLAFREGPHSRIALQPHFSGRQIERVAFPTSVSKIKLLGELSLLEINQQSAYVYIRKPINTKQLMVEAGGVELQAGIENT